MMKRAARKKAKKSFKVGDVVTWGNGKISHRVAQVQPTGVLVDITEHKDASKISDVQMMGRFYLFVSYDENNRNKSGRGPLRHSTDEPDKLKP